VKRVLFIALFFLLPLALLLGRQVWLPSRTVNAEGMAVANRLYEEGKYAQASQAYEQVAAQGVADAALFYNLGNAYFKQADVGRAILNYRRAGWISPRDADIHANLALARSQRLDRLEDEGEDALPLRLADASRSLTLDELATSALALWFLCALLLIAFSLAQHGSGLREGLQYALIVAALLLCAGVFLLASRLYLEQSKPDGVILAEQVEVSSAPGGGVVQFNLHSGAEVSILEQRREWVRLALPGGKLQGWLPASALARVTPPNRPDF